MDSQENTTFRTSDLYYAAYLKVAGVAYLGSTREDGRVHFLFENGPHLRDLRTQYFSRTARVPALSYADEIKAMKAVTHMS